MVDALVVNESVIDPPKVTIAVATPPLQLILYVVVTVGLTATEPLGALPVAKPLPTHVLAPDEVHVSVDEPPVMVDGEAVNVAVALDVPPLVA
jgi:hypothetical protein